MRGASALGLACSTLALLAAGAGAARAQAPTASEAQGSGQVAQASADSADGAQIAEVVVTARKVAESLQKVPLSVSAFTAGDLRRLGVREVSDLSSLAPGLNFEKDFGRRFDRPTIRGQSNILGNPNSASFIDGVFIPDSLFSTELAFVERVEVIKGPQSALYGRQTFSGAISYVTKKPTDTPETTLRGTVAEDGEYDLLGAWSGPIIKDVLSAQVAANYYTYDGQYRNVAPGDAGNGRLVGSEETKAFSGTLRFTPTPRLAITLRGAYAENSDGLEAISLQRASFNNCFPNAAGVFRYYCGEVKRENGVLGANTGSLPGFGGIDRDTTRIAGTVEYDFGPVKLTSITGYNRADEDRRWDIDNTSIQTGAGSRNVDDRLLIDNISEEVRLSSNDPASKLQWLVGFYYYSEDDLNTRFTYSTNVLLNNGVTGVTNYAGFGLVRYNFTDKLSASAELRYAEDNLTLRGGDANYNLNASYTSTNPRFTVDYKLRDNFLLYFVAARGNKPGGFNSDVRLPTASRSYGEETAWNYEWGFKSDLFDRRLRLNVAGYKIDWNDQQLTQSIIIPSCVAGQPANPAVPCVNGPVQTTSYILNVGGVEVNGVEVETIAAITRNWRINGNFSYNDAHFVSGTDVEVGTLTGNNSLVGKRPPNSPSTQFAIGTDYERPAFADYRFLASFNYSWRSRKFDQVGNFNWVPDRGTAFLRLALENPRYSFSLFARNLFDNIDPVTSTRWSDFAAAGVPRAFRLSLPRGRQIGFTAQARF